MRAAFLCALLCAVAQADTATNEHEPEVRTLVDAWRKAQNDGDFAAYQALYATRFTGVRRSGPRTLRFDRAGWMKDRQRMFGKKMAVGVEKLAIASGGSTARATFVQTFAQGSFSDSGEKQLVLVREGGALRIAQEEMLASRVAASSPIDSFAWIVDGGVQLTDSPDPAWGKGKRSVDVGQPTVVRQPVSARVLPPEWAAWKGRPVRTFDEKGTACEAKVTGFALVGRVIPHFGTVAGWRDNAGRDIADEAWQLSTKSLVAVLDGCSNARWARAAALPAPAVVDGEKADAALHTLALKKFAALPGFQTIQRSYEEQPQPGQKQWDPDPEVRVFRVTVRGRPVTWVSVSGRILAGCSELSADLWALFEVSGKTLTLRNTPGRIGIRPHQVIDVDGDGVPEILYEGASVGDYGTERGLVRAVNGAWDEEEKLSMPFLDCPC